MTAITKAYYSQLVREAKDLGVAEQPYVLASLLNVSGGGAGSSSLADILAALQTYGGNYNTIRNLLNSGAINLAESPEILFNGGIFYNPNAYPVFLKIYSILAPTVGTDVVSYSLMIPALGQVLLDSTTAYCTTANYLTACVTKFYYDYDDSAVDIDVVCFFKLKL